MKQILKETSCYSSALLIEYAKRKGFNVNLLFAGIEDKKEIFENRHEWIDYSSMSLFTKNFEKSGGNLFNAAVEITENQVSHFQLLFLKIASTPFIINNYSKHYEKKNSKTVSLKLDRCGKGTLDVIFIPKGGIKYSPQVCDFNRGCVFAAAHLKRLRNLQLTEITCAARSNAPECRYRITWTPDPPFLERLKNFFFFRFSSQEAILGHIDVTYDQLQAQYRELEGIKDFYHHIMQNMSEGVLWLDGEYKISFVNRGFFGMLRSAGETAIAGKDFRDFLANDVTRRIAGELFGLCRRSPGKAETFELAYKTAGGEERVGQTTCLWVDSVQQQKPGYLISIRDITDKRAVERKLSAVENRYRTLYESSPAAIFGLDLEGNFLYANKAMEGQSGYMEEELKKMHFSQLVVPREKNKNSNALLQPRLGGERLQELHYKAKNGDWKSITLATFPLYNEKWGVIGLGGIGVDITETMRLNQLLEHTQRMELLGQMAGGLAHDFKNLLSVISGYSKLIMDISPERKVQEFAGNIQIANDRAAVLTKKLLLFSRGDTAKNEPFILNDIILEISKLLPAVLGRTIQLNVELPPTEFYIMGDSDKIHQCLLNLCLNSRDAIGEKDGGSIKVRLKPDEIGGWCVIEVEDNGPGIPPDIIGRIFDPFFSTKKKSPDTLGGTGLGLSVVYGTVKSHGGEIRVDSRPGAGVTFRIRLPLVPEDAAGASNLPPKKRTVLIIESDAVKRHYCGQILTHNGYPVEEHSSFEESGAWLEKNAHGSLIALLPASQASAALVFENSHQGISTIWICEHDMDAPAGSKGPQIRRPFPPAALIETVKAIEREIGNTGSPPPSTVSALK